jgi:hypothetical protein
MNGIPQAHSITALIDRKMTNSGGERLQFPADRPKYYTQIRIMDVKGIVIGGNSQWKTNLQNTIILPLPVNLVEANQVKYDEKAISPVHMVAQVISEINPLTGAILESGARVGGALVGLAPNDYQTVLFDRPVFRRHELAWKLSPRNFAESTAIKNIIKELHRAMSPNQTWSFLWEYPDLFKIKYMPNEEWLYKFQPAVLENFAVNYAGGANKKAFYRDESGPGSNPPESVELTLHLLEIQYMTEVDYGEKSADNNLDFGKSVSVIRGPNRSLSIAEQQALQIKELDRLSKQQ